MTEEELRKLEQEPCACKICSCCGGTGHCGASSFASLEVDICDVCNHGIIALCDRCEALMLADEDDSFDLFLGAT